MSLRVQEKQTTQNLANNDQQNQPLSSPLIDATHIAASSAISSLPSQEKLAPLNGKQVTPLSSTSSSTSSPLTKRFSCISGLSPRASRAAALDADSDNPQLSSSSSSSAISASLISPIMAANNLPPLSKKFLLDIIQTWNRELDPLECPFKITSTANRPRVPIAFESNAAIVLSAQGQQESFSKLSNCYFDFLHLRNNFENLKSNIIESHLFQSSPDQISVFQVPFFMWVDTGQGYKSTDYILLSDVSFTRDRRSQFAGSIRGLNTQDTSSSTSSSSSSSQELTFSFAKDKHNKNVLWRNPAILRNSSKSCLSLFGFFPIPLEKLANLIKAGKITHRQMKLDNKSFRELPCDLSRPLVTVFTLPKNA